MSTNTNFSSFMRSFGIHFVSIWQFTLVLAAVTLALVGLFLQQPTLTGTLSLLSITVFTLALVVGNALDSPVADRTASDKADDITSIAGVCDTGYGRNSSSANSEQQSRVA